jgi:hypothetical protein
MNQTPYYRALATVSGNIKASSGALRSFKAINRNAAARYLQLFDSTSAPDSTNVPIDEFLIPAASQIVIGTDFFTLQGAVFAVGVSFGFSTGSGTYTAATAGDHDFSANVL